MQNFKEIVSTINHIFHKNKINYTGIEAINELNSKNPELTLKHALQKTKLRWFTWLNGFVFIVKYKISQKFS